MNCRYCNHYCKTGNGRARHEALDCRKNPASPAGRAAEAQRRRRNELAAQRNRLFGREETTVGKVGQRNWGQSVGRWGSAPGQWSS